MVSATGTAADRVAAAAAAAVAFVGIAVGYRIYSEARARLGAAKAIAVVPSQGVIPTAAETVSTASSLR